MKFKSAQQLSYQSSTGNPKNSSGLIQRNNQGLDQLQILANKSAQVTQLKVLKNQARRKAEVTQLKEEGSTAGKPLPNPLKTGVEQLSGVNMSDANVNFKSTEPSKIGAAAFAQGSNIHLGPGQEKHLPHEAWHVVQQKKGKVSATSNENGIALNESTHLEKEADQMGSKALELGSNTSKILQKVKESKSTKGIIQKNETDVQSGTSAETPEVVEASELGESVNTALIEKINKNRGLVEMAKNAPDIISDSQIWNSLTNKWDKIGITETVGGLTGDLTKAGSESTLGIDPEKVAANVSSSVGSSITTLFTMIKSIRTLYKGLAKKDKMAAASGSKDFVSAVKSGLSAANSILKFTTGTVNPGIVKAIPGLGIVVSAAEIMINLHNAWNASKSENQMAVVSEKYKAQLTGIFGGEPEKKAPEIFNLESRGKVFHKKDYLRLKPGIMNNLNEIEAKPDPDHEFDQFKTTHNLPSTLDFNQFHFAVRTYELGSKLQEINQKRKVHGGNEVFTSILSIAGNIASFFPADMGISAAALKGSSSAIKGGLAAGKFFQQQSRNKGWFGADENRAGNVKHKEYVNHTKSIYVLLSQAGLKDQDEMSLETSKIDQLMPIESMITASGASKKEVYNTNYGDKKSIFKQVELLVESMKKGRG